MEKVIELLRVAVPTLLASPGWAKGLYILTLFLLLTSLVTAIYYYTNPVVLPVYPYQGFNKFHEVLSPQYFSETNARLHVIFGNVAEVENTVVVLPINEELDFNQRGSRSVLFAFENHKVSRVPFYEAIESKFPKNSRPVSAGLGYCKYISLDNESNNLQGAIFVVTTRNLSNDKKHYGLYQDTPVEGIDSILDNVIQEIRTQKIESVAVPLLGAGYANIAVTQNNRSLKAQLDKIVALISIQKLEEALKDKTIKLKRAMIFVYLGDRDPHDREATGLWKDMVLFATKSKDEQVKLIREEIEQFEKERRRTTQ